MLDVKRAAARKCLMFEADGVADRLGGGEDLVDHVAHKSGVRNASLYYLLESEYGSLHTCTTRCCRFVSSHITRNIQHQRVYFAT